MSYQPSITFYHAPKHCHIKKAFINNPSKSELAPSYKLWYDILSNFIGRWYGLIQLLTRKYIKPLDKNKIVWALNEKIKYLRKRCHLILLSNIISSTKPINSTCLILQRSKLFWKYISISSCRCWHAKKVKTEGCCISPTFQYFSLVPINLWVLFTTWSNWSDLNLHPYLAHPVFSMYLQEWQKLFIQSYSYPRIMCMLCVAFMLDECVFRNIYVMTNTYWWSNEIQRNKRNNIL